MHVDWLTRKSAVKLGLRATNIGASFDRNFYLYEMPITSNYDEPVYAGQTCSGVTKKGKSCTRKAYIDGRCSNHQ